MIEIGLTDYKEGDLILDIRDKNQIIKARYGVNAKDIEKYTLMKEHYIELSFFLNKYMPLKRADYIDWDGMKFMLKKDYRPNEINKKKFEYKLKFEALWMILTDIQYYYLNQDMKESEWRLTGNPEYFLKIGIDNINRYFGTEQFKLGVIELDEMMDISFDINTNTFDAFNQVAEKYEAEWYMTGYTLNFVKKVSFGAEIEFETDVSIQSISRSEGENSKVYYNRILALGSTRNIPRNYREPASGEAVDKNDQERLRIPIDKGDVIDAFPNMSPEEVVEGTVIFDEVYPKRIGTIEAVGTIDYKDTNTETGEVTNWKAYKIKDSGLNFKEEYMLPGQELRIVFESGNLKWMDFALEFYKDGFSKTDDSQYFEIFRNEDYGKPLPNETLRPQVGDTYAIYGFDIQLVSDAFVPAAEKELFETASAWLQDLQKDKGVYDCKTMKQHFADNEMNLEIGQKVKLVFGVEGNRNYLRGTSNRRVVSGKNITNQVIDAYPFVNGSIAKAGLAGKQITISCKYEVIGETISGSMIVQGNSPFPHFGSIRFSPTNSSGTHKYTTIILPKFEVTTNLQIRVDNLPIGTNLIISEIQIELGDEATPWKPAQEDIDGATRSSRIMGYEKKLINKYDATYKVGDNAVVSRLGSMESKIEELEYAGKMYQSSGGSGVYLIKQFDTTRPSDFNAYSSKASDARYLNKQTGGTVQGNTAFQKDVQIQGKTISDEFGNNTFTSGPFGSGFKFWKDNIGSSYGEIDYIRVRKEMSIHQLIIDEIRSVGGTILLSLAHMKITKVVDSTTYWRAYFDNDNGNNPNQFVVNDQEFCQKVTGSNIKRYWAKITAIGTDYIDISKTDKDGSGVPAVGDEVIQLGNRTDTNRQYAILLSSVAQGFGFRQYWGINSYDLTGKEITRMGDPIQGNYIKGEFVIQATNKNVGESILELDENIVNAEQKATEAKTEASKAKDAASKAQADATTANSLLSDIANDNKLTPNEKQETKKEWDAIVSEYQKNVAQANKFGIPLSVYTNAYNALSTYLSSLLNPLNSTSDINGATFRTTFKSYYDARLDLLNNISVKAKELADNAQQSANNAQKEAEKVRTEYKTDFKVLEDEIALRVTQSEFDELGGRVSDAQAQIELQGNQISSTVEKIDNIKVGGRNYLLDTSTAKTGIGNNTTNQVTWLYAASPDKAKLGNQTVVLSFDWKAEGEVLSGTFTMQNNVSPWGTFHSAIKLSSSNSSGHASRSFLFTQANTTIGSIQMRMDNVPVGTKVTISNMKLEIGNKETDHTIAPEDIESQIKQANDKAILAQSVADTANNEAVNAKNAASKAQTDANTANSLLADIASDSKLTPNEKQDTRKEWETIQSEYSKNIANASKFNVPIADYTNAYNSLSSYITPLLANIGATSDVNGTTFGNIFKSYYDARTDLLNTISSKAKELADKAQNSANDAQSTANSKIRTYHQDDEPKAPSGGHGVGDLWTMKSLVDYDGNINADATKNLYQLQHRWNGVSWERINWSATRSAIKQTEDQIKLEVSSIQFGGRNYLLSTANKRTIIGLNISNQVTWGYNFVNGSVAKAGIADKDITLSFKYEASGLDKAAWLSIQGDAPYPYLGGISITTAKPIGFFKNTIQIKSSNSASTRINFRVDNLPSTATIIISEVQIELGNKESDWKPAIEDTQTAIDKAQAAADLAQTNATNANNILSDISNDNKLTPNEKQNTKKEWDAIQSEYSKNITQAINFSVPYTVYTNAYNSLNSYITPLLSNLGVTSDINGATFRSTFKSYLDARTDLMNAIAAKAKSIADSKTTLDEVKSGMKVEADGVTIFGKKFVVDSLMIAKAIEAESLTIRGSVDLVWDGDKNKPLNRIALIDSSSTYQETRVLIHPSNINENLDSDWSDTSIPLPAKTIPTKIINGKEYGYVHSDSFTLPEGNNYDLVFSKGIYARAGSGVFLLIPVIDGAPIDPLNPTSYFPLLLYPYGLAGSSDQDIERWVNNVPGGTYVLAMAYNSDEYDFIEDTFIIPTNTTIKVKAITRRTEIGLNGLISAFAKSKYFKLTEDGLVVEMGSYGLKITSSGVQVKTLGSWKDIQTKA